VWIQLEVAHDLAEHVPFHLRECQADVFVRQQGVIAASSLIQCAIDHAFGRLGHLVLRDIEIFHGRLQGEWRSASADATRCSKGSKSKASDW
jgi:hypothetical protein